MNRSSLRIIGLWFEEDHAGTMKFLRKLRNMGIVLIILFVCVLPCLYSLIKQCDSLMAVIDNLSYTIPLTITLMKYIVILSKKEVLLPLVNMIAEDWAKLKTDFERDVMIQRTRITRATSILSYALIFTAVMFMIVLPRTGITTRYVTNETNIKKLFPVPTYYIYDISETPYFEIMFLLQMATLVLMALCYIGVDNFFGILILHICGQLENLRTRLANIKHLETFDRILVTTVEDHVRLIRAVDVIESIFTMLVLALLFYFGTFACIYGLLLMTILTQEEQFSVLRITYLACIFLNTFLQTSLYCITGQILVNQSEEVYVAAYECEWLNLKSNKAKSLILIMARAQRPLCLTAGKLFPMTMLTFCNVTQLYILPVDEVIVKYLQFIIILLSA
ncbi:Putative odorant receptor 30a [Habropoda laboriosa]|uniref:Odorant receptor n=1 Tax=Habropoda laboriosa TaxID=597456 RepID=A0A0L7RAV6_9HYME|nr:Putative odorant receptor 30a [Habropoda laboriosa]